jgi:lipopolysaccharide export system permease protein
MAKDGKMYKTGDDKYLVLKLNNGVRYEETAGKNTSFNPRQELYRMRFKETEQKFDFSSFKMSRTDENSFRSNTAMLNLKGLVRKKDSLTKILDSTDRYAKLNIGSYYKQTNYTKGYTKIKAPVEQIKGPILNVIPKKVHASVLQSALDQVNSIQQATAAKMPEHEEQARNLIRIDIEYQRKFTLAVSCLLLFFIGAPLGAIIRKGGLGLPVVMAIVFFLIYHIISTVSEKSANQGNISPVLGIWMAIIVLSPLGAFLTYKATVDSALFDTTYYKTIIVNLFKRKKSSA